MESLGHIWMTHSGIVSCTACGVRQSRKCCWWGQTWHFCELWRLHTQWRWLPRMHVSCKALVMQLNQCCTRGTLARFPLMDRVRPQTVIARLHYIDCWSTRKCGNGEQSNRRLLKKVSRVDVISVTWTLWPKVGKPSSLWFSACDVGAVVSHKTPHGSEKPVRFASGTLTETKKKYSQVEKEALACVYGVKHFHAYLPGHRFMLQTDHEPQQTLFGESKAVPPHTSNRIQRWAWTLALYEYSIKTLSAEKQVNMPMQMW